MDYKFVEILKILLHLKEYYFFLVSFPIIILFIMIFISKYSKIRFTKMAYIISFIVSFFGAFIQSTMIIFLLSKDFVEIVSWFTLTRLASLGALFAGIGSIANALLSNSSLKIAKRASDQAAYSNILAAERSVFPKIQLVEAEYNDTKNNLYLQFYYFEDILNLFINFSEEDEKLIPKKDIEIRLAHRQDMADESLKVSKEEIIVSHLIYREIKSSVLDINPAYVEFYVPIEAKNEYLISIKFMSKFHSYFENVYLLSKNNSKYKIKLVYRKLPWNEIYWFDSTFCEDIKIDEDGVVKIKKILIKE